MTDQLSSDFQWALLQQQLQHQRQYQQQQQQLQQQQQQHEQPTPTHVRSNLIGDFQGPSELSMTGAHMTNHRNNNNNININVEAQRWQLYQNFNSSASEPNKINPAMVMSSSTPFTANEGSSTHNFSQSQNMMAQYLQMQMQRQSLPNAHVGGSPTSPHSNEMPVRSNTNTTTTQGASNAVNQLMLHSKVEPFQRANSSSTVEDEDLWKVFDDEFLQSSTFDHTAYSTDKKIPTKYSQQDQDRPVPSGRTDRPQDITSSSEPLLAAPGHVLDYETEPFILPSTMIPPSVLAFSSGPSKRKWVDDTAPPKQKRLKHMQSTISPQSFMEKLISDMGHTYKRIPADDAEYEATPSALQLASFGTILVKAVHTSDVDKLRNLLACGLSPNPCNQFRDSILDLVCKRANESVFELLLEMGADLQVVDAFGRTPLHHACWASEFCAPIVSMILQRDPAQLYIEDRHGQTPLEYVRADLIDEWMEYLQQNVHTFYNTTPCWTSPQQRRPKGSVLDPENSIGASLAALVSSGTVSPAQISQMDEETRHKYRTKG